MPETRYILSSPGLEKVDGINPASPNIYYTTTSPRVSVCEVTQDLHHQQ